MLRNLQAEMARNGVSAALVATTIGKSERTVKDTIAEKYQFGIFEAFAIRDNLFPGMTLEYLFVREGA